MKTKEQPQNLTGMVREAFKLSTKRFRLSYKKGSKGEVLFDIDYHGPLTQFLTESLTPEIQKMVKAHFREKGLEASYKPFDYGTACTYERKVMIYHNFEVTRL